MKALTVKHPWAWAICRLGKRLENRNWYPSTVQLARGDYLAIHGGVAPKTGRARDEFEDDVDAIMTMLRLRPVASLDGLILPGIVAVAIYDGYIQDSTDPWFSGPYAWRLKDVVILPEPIACQGKQGLWEVPTELVTPIRLGYRRAKWPEGGAS